MKKVLYLSTCNTCKRILSEVNIEGFDLQDTKKTPASKKDIEFLRQHVDSYEALINRRAQLWQKRGLKNQNLSEEDFKALLLEHYSFIKRPIFIDDDKVFIGNSKKVVEALKGHLSE
ncbi:arsenate reductase family protein [Mesohalobacter halotolerans]|uniref:Arsenate reductase n=1 Tax=Mesohalobacter halotolerans TaxID=1883405 RepID=A0A4U5TSV4_9FLAO|nr:ArsC/Spx/MgsR family protein [Mesohalobacter halotolerans]MBS3738351.1 arsenate reductase [Psychroflexus sp.]TKS57256.1 arsenate reductase [Mesohalobacter halotolerans]